jgi:hypothetical protein
MYISTSSAHSKKLKQGILKGEFLRFITLCSTEKDFDKACVRYDKALQTRGYTSNGSEGMGATVTFIVCEVRVTFKGTSLSTKPVFENKTR